MTGGTQSTKLRKEIRNMARIAGIDLPRDTRVEIGLTYIYGIGRTSSNKILASAKVNPDTRVRDLTDEEVKRISEVIGNSYMVEHITFGKNMKPSTFTAISSLLAFSPTIMPS